MATSCSCRWSGPSAGWGWWCSTGWRPEVETTQAFGLQLDVAQTQLLWFTAGTVAMLAVAIGLRDDGLLRHYKYSWAALGIGLLGFTALFGRVVNGARLWIDLGPVGIQPGEFIKIILVVFIAGYLADNRALLSEATARIGPIRVPPLPYLLPMLALFGVVMLVVVRQNDLGQALLLFGIFLTMLFVATGRRSYVLIGLILFVAGSFAAYELFPHVAARVDIWLDPFADPQGRRLPAGARPLRPGARRALRRGAGPGAADLHPVRAHRLHLRRGGRGAGAGGRVRAAGHVPDLRVPRPAHHDARPRRVQRAAGGRASPPAWASRR